MAAEKIARAIIVYKVTNTVTGRAYIGIAGKRDRYRSSLKKRWAEHLSDAYREGGDRYDRPLYRAIRKHGADAFIIEAVYEAVDEQEACAVERGLIAQYGTLAPNGYNLTSGGEMRAGFAVSSETRAKISLWHTGRPRSAAHKAAIAEGMKGRPVSEETRRKLSAAKLGRSVMTAEGRKRLSAFRTGRAWSEESRAKASSSHKGKPWSEARKAYLKSDEYLAKMKAASDKAIEAKRRAKDAK